MKLAVVILAAGASSRMGRPKLLLPWDNNTVLGRLLTTWQAFNPAQLAIVISPQNQSLEAELDRLEWPRAQRILNPAPERGMFSSVRCAAGWSGWEPGLTHWAIALGDQPLVRRDTLRQLLEFAGEHPASITQPSRSGRGRHPVILPGDLFAQVTNSTATDLKQFLVTSGWPVVRYESEDSGLDLDLDEPADYERALARAAAVGP